MSAELIAKFVTDWLYPLVLVVFFFGLTIFVHEWGHYLIARWRGMKIERFSIGFGPKIFGWRKHGIEYRVAWIPFGGYVALPQMAPMEVLEGKSETRADQLLPASPTSKVLVAFSGPLMNLVFAVLLACLVWWIGLPTPVNPSIVGWVEPGSLEEQLGIRAGDRIVQVGDRPVKTWLEINRAVAVSRESTIEVVIERKGERHTYTLETEISKLLGIKTINLYPQGRPYARQVLAGQPAALAGIRVGDKFLAVDNVPVSSAEELRELIGKRADQPTKVKVLRDGRVTVVEVTPTVHPKEGVGRMGVILGDEMEYEVVRPGPTPLQQFKDIFELMGDTLYALVHSKQTGVGAHSLSGPVGIMGGWWYEITRGGVMRGVWFAVLLNLNLALINLLPIPVLDGGHIVFALVESCSRRPLNAKLVQALSTAFAALLIGLILYITFFDIQRLSFGRLRFGDGSAPTNQAAPVESPAPLP